MDKICVKIAYKNLHLYNNQGSPLWWEWCVETLGPPTNVAYGRPATECYWGVESNGRMFFRNPEHATAFALRWA